MILGVANHLWQSTLFVVLVWMLTLVASRNAARVRYWLWLTASVKFLLPLGALLSLGRQLPWGISDGRSAQAALVLTTIGAPFSHVDIPAAPSPVRTAQGEWQWIFVLFLAVWLIGCAMHLLTWWVRWRRLAAIARAASAIEHGPELDAVRRLSATTSRRLPVTLMLSDKALEPSVVGIWRPVLLWPRALTERLIDEQIEAVVAHELCHARYRDNLTIGLHMAVEALFWFHPLVWWVEHRLIDERERACDEEVIRLGSKPHVYAESILKTCQLSVESPLVCVAGITGSHLKRRIETIMRGHTTQSVEFWKAALFAMVAVASVASPVGVGLITAPSVRAQSVAPVTRVRFEVASVKPNQSTQGGGVLGRIEPGGRYTIINMPLRRIIRAAYAEGQSVEVDAFRVVEGPNWIDSDRFDIVAKADGNPSRDQFRAMLRHLLTDRFQLAVRHATSDLPVYALLKARPDGRLGPRLRPTVVDCDVLLGGPPTTDSTDAMPPCGALQLGPGRLIASGLPVDVLAQELSSWVNRVVDNRTGLSGYFDVHLEWTPDEFPADSPWVNGRPVDSGWPVIFTAVEEQLGLKLESTRGSVPVLVIDNVEQPTPD